MALSRVCWSNKVDPCEPPFLEMGSLLRRFALGEGAGIQGIDINVSANRQIILDVLYFDLN